MAASRYKISALFVEFRFSSHGHEISSIFVLFKTKENANYSLEPGLCSFVAAQFETSLLQLGFLTTV